MPYFDLVVKVDSFLIVVVFFLAFGLIFQHVPVLRSVLNVDQLGWILGKLRQLQTWIEQNFRFLLPDREGG